MKRELTKASTAFIAAGFGVWIVGLVILENLDFDSPAWLFSVLSVITILGPTTVVFGLIGLLTSAGFADRHNDKVALMMASPRDPIEPSAP